MNEAGYSYVNMILLSVIGGIFVSMSALVGYWASYVNRQLDDLRTLAGKHERAQGEHMTWATSHDKQDDERHKEQQTTLKNLERGMSDIREKRRREDWKTERHHDEG